MAEEAAQIQKMPDIEGIKQLKQQITEQLSKADPSLLKNVTDNSNKEESKSRETKTSNGLEKSLLDEEKLGSQLQAYFLCVVKLFKELNSVSGDFHESFSNTLNTIVNKAVRCLSQMSSIGSMGSFDFAKSFNQKNMLKLLLQAKVIDKNCSIDTEVWRPTKKPESVSLNTHEQIGKVLQHQVLGMFRKIVCEVCNPKKDLQRRLEVMLKRQLYKQFLQNFKRGEGEDFNQVLQSKIPGLLIQSETIEASEKEMVQSRSRTKVKQSGNKDGFTKPQSRSKSMEKSTEKQAQKKMSSNQGATANQQRAKDN